jgi:O-methyltransferase
MNNPKPLAATLMPLVSKLPLIRRYREEAERLRHELAAARDELEQVRAAQPDAEWLATARRYEYLWGNAFKKNDIRHIQPFGALAAKVIDDGRTYLNLDRLYTLWQLVERLPESAAAIAEVGVYKGGSARFIAEAMRLRGREIPFYVCDTFRGHEEVDPAFDGRHRVGEQFVHVKFEKVKKYLSKFPFIQVIQGNIRETAAAFAGERAFGFVHLDVDVYPITRFCLEFFASRMVTGGAIVVDDYSSRTCEGVTRAVDEFAAASDQYVCLQLLTGQAVLILVSDTVQRG